MQMHFFAHQSNIARLQTREINSRDDFTMHQHQKPIASQKIREDRIFLRPRHHFVHRVNDSLQPLQPLNAIDHGGLAHVNAKDPASHRRPKMAQQTPPRTSREHQPSSRAKQHCPEKQSDSQRQPNRQPNRRPGSSRSHLVRLSPSPRSVLKARVFSSGPRGSRAESFELAPARIPEVPTGIYSPWNSDNSATP